MMMNILAYPVFIDWGRISKSKFCNIATRLIGLHYAIGPLDWTGHMTSFQIFQAWEWILNGQQDRSGLSSFTMTE